MKTRPPDPLSAQSEVWAFFFALSLLVVFLVSAVWRGFPISDPAIALDAFPKLAANAGCVESLGDVALRDAYFLRYANTAVWAALAGGFFGLTFWPACGVARRGAPELVEGIPDERQIVPVNTLKRFAAGVWLVILLGGLFIAFPLWSVFHGSACFALDQGLPEYRAFHSSAIPAMLAGLPATMAGFAVERASAVLRHVWTVVGKHGQR